jgi:hypothetical protein
VPTDWAGVKQAEKEQEFEKSIRDGVPLPSEDDEPVSWACWVCAPHQLGAPIVCVVFAKSLKFITKSLKFFAKSLKFFAKSLKFFAKSLKFFAKSLKFIRLVENTRLVHGRCGGASTRCGSSTRRRGSASCAPAPPSTACSSK